MFKRKRKMSAYDELVEEVYRDSITVLKEWVHCLDGTSILSRITHVERIQYDEFGMDDTRYFVALECGPYELRPHIAKSPDGKAMYPVVDGYIPEVGDQAILNRPMYDPYTVSPHV